MKRIVLFLIILCMVNSCNSFNKSSPLLKEKLVFLGYSYKYPVFNDFENKSLIKIVNKDTTILSTYSVKEEVLFFRDDFYFSRDLTTNKYYFNNTNNISQTELHFESIPYNLTYNSFNHTILYNIYSDDKIRLLNLETFKVLETKIRGNIYLVKDDFFIITRDSNKDVVYPSVDLYKVDLDGKEIILLHDLSGEMLFVSPKEDFVIDQILRNGKFKLCKVNLEDKSLIEIRDFPYYYSYQTNDVVYYHNRSDDNSSD